MSERGQGGDERHDPTRRRELFQSPISTASTEPNALEHSSGGATLASGSALGHDEQIEAITESLFAMSAFDFSLPVPLRGTSDAVDHLAGAVRVLQMELAATAVSGSHVASLLASIPNPVAILHLDGRVHNMNQAMEPLIAGVLGERDASFLDWLEKNRFDNAVGSRPTGSWHVELEIGGESYHYLFAVAPLVSHFDDTEGYVAVGTDISQRVQIEEELHRAKKLADAHALARSTFIANVSHEIRTPLTGILGSAELLKSASLDAEAREHIRTILACGEHLLALIGDVLDLSRIDSNKLELEDQQFNLHGLARDCLASARSVHSKESVRAALEFDKNLPSLVSGDATRLRQILFNLLNNALRFTAEGTVELRAMLVNADEDRARVRIEVRDTGIGIAEDKLDDLFEPFVQADIATARKYGGSGLGLAIVKRLVDLMNGEVGASSTFGQGSTFWVVLPLRIVRAAEPAADESSGTYRSPIDNAKILLVEDSPVTQRLTAKLLRRAGCNVHIASNGAEALQQVAQERFDVILMDCRMPVMDGLTAVRKLRERETERRTPVIALTADAFEEHRRECLAAGMDDYLRKPIHKIELYKKLAAYLDRS